MKQPKNITFAQALKEIIEFFGYDKDKALMWYMRPCIHFQNLSPYEMIKAGKGQQLMRYIRDIELQKYIN